jgi:putative ABC transport system permease protein
MDFFITALVQGFGFAAIGLGIFLALRIFNIPDITADGSYALGGVITAILIANGINPILAIIASIIAGSIAGITTGLIHTKLKFNPLLAGILVMTALYSVNLFILGRPNLPLLNYPTIFNLLPIKNQTLNSFVVLSIIIFSSILILNYLLKTDFGIAMRATGNNETMVKAMGVNTDSMKIIGLAIANSLTALSGSLITQYQGFADINMGIGIVISALGAVMIGETLLKLFKVKNILLQLISVLVGCIIFRLILAFALSIGIDPTLLKLVTSLLVILIVGLGNIKSILKQ